MIDLDVHLTAIAVGDDRAFAAWLAGAEPQIRRSLSGFAAQVDTEAVLQEALLRVWQVAPRFRPDGRPNGLLRLGVRIARNRTVSELRRRHVPPATTEELSRLAEETAIDPVEPDPLLRAALERCREQLRGPPARALASRLAGAVRSDRDSARELGMKLNTFLQNVRRARQALVRCLERAGIHLEEVTR